MFRRKPDPDPLYRREYWHQIHVVKPLEATLINSLPLGGWNRRPLIDVPHDYRDPASDGVVFHVPTIWHVTSDLKRRTVDLIASRLGITDPTASWSLSGMQPRVVIKARQRMPQKVAFADHRDTVLRLPDTQPFIGVSSGGAIITADLEDDSPHLLVSAGTGAGKSSLTRLIGCQAIRSGGQLIVLDAKRTSHSWAKRINGVTYCKTIPEIHDALVTVADIAEQRNEEAEDPDAHQGPRLWVLAEEMNMTAERLRDHWDAVRVKTDPRKSPAIAALKTILFTGRSARVHVIAVAQRMDANLLGGGAARENFTDRYLARFSKQTWAMLAGDAGTMPAKSDVPGRWVAVKHGRAHQVQVGWISETEATEWASRPKSVTSTVRLDIARSSKSVLARTTMGLRDALPYLGQPELSLDALRKLSQRDETFPAPLGFEGGQYVYDLDCLVRWRRGRLFTQELPPVGETG